MQSKNLKILAIDDHQDNLISLKAVLTDVLPGARVWTALTGITGIELARVENPDVILLDIIMPEMDGFEVCRRLKADEHLQHIPVLFLTVLKTHRELRLKALDVGGEAFLAKPFDETELIAQILSMAKINAANMLQQQENERLVVLVAERTREIEQELSARRLVEQELLLANENLSKNQTDLLKALDDLKAENEARRQSEQALREAIKFSQEVIDSAQEGIIVLDRDLLVRVWNPFMEKLSGVSTKQMLAKHYLETLPNVNKNEALVRIKRSLAGEILDDLDTYYYLPENGQTAWTTVTSGPLTNSEGEILGVISTVVNITERKIAEEALRESVELFRTIFEQAPLGIALIDSLTGKFLNINPRFAEIVGRTMQEMLARDWMSITHPEDMQADLNNMARLNAGEINGYTMNKRYLRLNNSEIWVNMTIAAISAKDKAQKTHLAMIEDISERKQNEQKLIYTSTHDFLTDLYNRAYFEEKLKDFDQPQYLPLTLVMADINGLKLTNDALGSEAGDNLLRKTAQILKNNFRSNDFIARIGGDEFVIILRNTTATEAEEIINGIKRLISEDRVDTIPLSVSFGNETKQETTENLDEILKKAENNMHRTKLFESPSIRSKTIYAIMHTLHEKNSREEQHSTRVSILCETMGIALGMTDNEINELKTVGLLHDIGKVAIDEGILNKPDRLTRDDWLEMKRHPEIGYRILRSVEDMSYLAEYVLCHHERWDGKGYPKGLQGAKIPYKARIIAIADTYDAMTSERAYRGALSEETAIEEIIKNAGKQFDPEIARVFVEKVLGKQWN